jgi:hypothetical protein
MSSISMFKMSSRVNRIALVAGVLLLGCGSSGGGGNAAPFVGMWTYSSGTLTPMMCSILGTTIPPRDLSGDTVTISMGTDSSHLQFVEGTACTINFSVSGTTATAAAGQSCTITVMGVAAVLNVSAWTLTLTGDTISTTFSGSAQIGGANCTASGSGTLQRNSTDGAAGG